jgi:hypothetical protein
MFAALAAGAMIAITPAASAASADGTDVTLGNRSLKLPVPAGFAPPASTAPDQRALAERMTRAEDRLLAVMLPQDYVAHRAAGDKPHMSRYMLVKTMRDGEQAGVDEPTFEQAKTQFRANAEAMLNKAREDVRSRNDEVVAEVGRKVGDTSASIEMGAVKSLGVFDEHRDSIALATVQPISSSTNAGKKTFNQVMAFAIVLVHRKPVLATVYSDYGSQADIDWAENLIRAWVVRVGELNP